MGSHSGLVRLLGEQLYSQGYREFESRPHRQTQNCICQLYLPLMPNLNDNQLRQLADFMSNLGLVFFAVSITPLFSGIDTFNIFGVILGLVASMFCLVGSMLLLKEK